MSDQRTSPDAKFDLARAAFTNERRNRPRQLVIVSVMVLGVSCLWAFTGFQSARAAAGKLRVEHETLLKVALLTEEIARYRDQESARGGEDQFEPIPDLSSKLEKMAVDAGMQKPTRPANPTSTDVKNSNQLTRTTIAYGFGRGNRTSIPTQPLGPMLRWIVQAQDEIEGLKVERLTIKRPRSAAKEGWDLQVSFARLERKQ